MNAINHFNEVIEYIEKNLAGDISIADMAKMAQMSIYEFRRVFSFAAGVSVSEYIRRRRLSAAAEELSRFSVTELALKYGYDTPSSFSRAFKEFHGVAPSALLQNGAKMNLFTKIAFDFKCTGGNLIQYEVKEDSGFFICGLAEISDLSDTECCENVWNRFYEKDGMEAMCRESGSEIYAAYTNGENAVLCTIGARKTEKPGKGDCIRIPSCRWACFQMKGSDDKKVNAFYKNIVVDFLHSSKCRKAQDIPNLEVYPVDMEDEDFLWEIRIPIA